MIKQPSKKKMWMQVLFIAFVAIALGFLRDSIFKTINSLLRAWDLDQDYFLPPFLSFLENFQYDTLVNLKWILTLLFLILYLLLSLITIKILFGNRNFSKITIWSYVAILIVSGILITIGYVFKGTTEKPMNLQDISWAWHNLRSF
ncbi:MAG: hypothetical protein IPP64_11175 [Bacteroidetes bacterium]|nr:hypothetical protein [Bacteroidota bacterium]